MVEPHALVAQAVGAVVLALEAAAALVILVAGAQALAGFTARILRRGRSGEVAHRALRHDFGRSLLLALDFTLGADVLKVALAPGWEAVGLAGAVVLVRTVLTLVLEHEVAREERSDRAREGAHAR